MAQGRWKEAEELFVQVIKMRKRVLGEEHPDTLTSIDVQESRPMEGGRRARGASDGDFQEVLGEEHPGGQDAEAIKLLKKCVQLQTQILGADHPYPSTLSSSAALIGWRLMPSRRSREASG